MNKIRIVGALCALLLLTNCGPSPTLEITFGGDIMLARDRQALFENNPWPDNVPTDKGLFFANLESPLKEGEEIFIPEGYNLCADAKQVDLLAIGGIDLVTTANNHQADCGQVVQTGPILEKAGILSVSESSSPIYFQTKVGLLGVIAVDAVAEQLELETLLRQVRTAREQCDILIVSLHWGFEYLVEPSQAQREWAQKLADAGVDVLWGHHPHVLQPMEWVSAIKGDHKMLAIYSLGNLLADQWMTWDTQHSALVTIIFSKSGADSLSVQPIQLDPGSRKLVEPSAESRERIKVRLGVDQ